MKFNLIAYIFSGLLALSSWGAVAQTVSGSIVDAEDNSPLPGAVVSAVNNSGVQSSSTTDLDGAFSLNRPAGTFWIEVQFFGYEDLVYRNIPSQSGNISLGPLAVEPLSENLEEVVVTAERSSVEFRLDKRVFNVGDDISSTGMGALDVLNNVPSVNVNIEGEISLRGSGGVQILINGKPSVLADEQSNALGTITADMIERIEVITSPSAKYEAEGTSGIINIILKKEEKKGINGSVSLNTGIPNNHSVGGSVNYRTENFNFFTQFGAGYRTRPSFSNSTIQNAADSILVQSRGESARNEEFYNITLGTDYYINDYNTITLSGRYAYELENNPSSTEFEIFDPQGNLTSVYSRNEVTEATNPKWQYDLQYAKTFENNEDHTLIFSTLGSFFGKDQSSEFTNEIETGGANVSNQRTATNFYQADYTFKLDYVNPLSDEFVIEAGSMYEINDVGNDYAVFDRTGGSWVLDSSLTNDFTYIQRVLGVYATGSYERNRWGVKVGLRYEHTDLLTRLETTEEENQQLYSNFFPSLHTSFKWTENFSLQAGYSKRIFRPRLWHLNPFFNIQNNYNIRTGNPNLEPEFADSYELTGIYVRDKYSITAGVYYLYTTNVHERISSFENGVTVTMPVNLGTNSKTGIEVNGKYDATSWLNFLGDFNYGYFVRTGQFESQDFNFSNDQWNARLTSKIKLPKSWDIELTGQYNSSYQTVQGMVSGYASADFGLRKKVWDGKMVLSLGVRDIFASRIRESLIDQPDYYLYNFSQRGRFITFGVSYGFGKGEAMSYTGGRHH